MMRPTASSASKVHDKPGSPPRRSNSTRVSAKAKTGAPESTVTKANKKVEEARLLEHLEKSTGVLKDNAMGLMGKAVPDQPDVLKDRALEAAA